MTPTIAPKFGNLFVLGPDTRREAERKFDQRGQSAYLDYIYGKTQDKAVQKNNLVVVSLSDERELLATNTKYAHKDEIEAMLRTKSDTPPDWNAYVEARKTGKNKVTWLG